jgi:hypothetical protein
MVRVFRTLPRLRGCGSWIVVLARFRQGCSSPRLSCPHSQGTHERADLDGDELLVFRVDPSDDPVRVLVVQTYKMSKPPSKSKAGPANQTNCQSGNGSRDRFYSTTLTLQASCASSSLISQ